MYSTSVKIVTSYKAINLPYENNVSSSSLLWFSSTPFPPDFCLYLSWIQHLPDEKWMQIEDLEKIRQKTSNHRLWVTFFSFFSQVESGRILYIWSLIDWLIPNRFYRKFSFIPRFWKASITRPPRSLYQFPKPSDRNFL